MKYKLIWKNEVIESEIKDLETAIYLKGEYIMAFNDSNIVIRRDL